MRTPYKMPRETICSQRDVESRAVAAVAWLTGAGVSGQLLAVGGELESSHNTTTESNKNASAAAAAWPLLQGEREASCGSPPPPG